MMAGARDWLQGLSASERLLIVLAVGLALLLGGSLYVVAPLRAAHADAVLDYADAARLLEESRQGAAFAASSAPAGGEDARAAAMTSAVARGLAIARMSPVERDGLSVRLEGVDPALLYAWLAELEASHGVGVRRASLRRVQGAQTVDADIVLGGAS